MDMSEVKSILPIGSVVKSILYSNHHKSSAQYPTEYALQHQPCPEARTPMSSHNLSMSESLAIHLCIVAPHLEAVPMRFQWNVWCGRRYWFGRG